MVIFHRLRHPSTTPENSQKVGKTSIFEWAKKREGINPLLPAIFLLLLLPFPHPWYFSFPGSQWQLVLRFWDSMTTTTTPYLGQRPPTAWMRCV